jgi:transposase
MFDGEDSPTTRHRGAKGQAGRGRRRWSAADKARVVAEATAPGAVVSAVARRWQVRPQQVFAWRREAGCVERAPRSGVALADASVPAFVPILAATEAAGADPASAMASAPAIEIELAGAVVRVAAGADTAQLAAVLRAIRASATAA